MVFLTVTEGPGEIGMFSVNLSGVVTISTSLITLYCCQFSHFQEYLYDLLIFSRHLCSYISLLLKIGQLQQ